MGLFVLPLLATSKNRLWWGAGVGTFAIVVYGLSGRLALSLEPRELPPSVIDQVVPFLPTTLWIYSSVYLIYVASCLLQRDIYLFGRFLYAYLFAYSLSAIFFLVYPTTFPRADYPLPSDLDAITRTAFEWLRATDAPTNCLPSMHVGSAVMSTLPFYRRRPRLFLAFSIWTAAIGIATLTTKQHYSVDVISGALFGAFSYGVANFWPTRISSTSGPSAPTKNATRMAPDGDLIG
jgi:membrane-associated phospholipid phosphatase